MTTQELCIQGTFFFYSRSKPNPLFVFQADQLVEKRGEEVEKVVRPEQQKVNELWKELKDMLKDRDERLNESSELQRFLQNLDHFQVRAHLIVLLATASE